MKRVYLDTNAYDHIYKRLSITDSDLHALEVSIQQGKMSVMLSVLNIEEVLCAITADPTLALRELWLMLDLGDWQRILKPADMLLTDDITAYARGIPPPEPFIEESHPVRARLQTLRDPTQRDIDELLPFLEESREQREGFRSGMRAAREQVLPYARKLGGWQPPFDDYWARLAEPFAESYAEHAGLLDACRARGIPGLLDLRSVRIAVGVNLSLAYAETFEGRAPDMGDSRDQQHAVLASAADVFVTQDSKFLTLLARIPMSGIQVMDLRGFLETIR